MAMNTVPKGSDSSKPRRSKKSVLPVDPVKSIESDREFKAYIYQQLVDLQPYLEPESQISVLVQVEQDEETETGLTIILSLVASVSDYKLESEGRSADMYEAFSMAKRSMLAELEQYYNAAIDSTERESEIRTLLSGGMTLH